MTLSEKMQRMTEMLYRFGADLKKNDDSCKCYIAPDIPEKIIKNLIKNYDNHIAINSIVGYYNSGFFGIENSGIIFSREGIYFKKLSSKAIYFRYEDISSCNTYAGDDGVNNRLELNLRNCDIDTYTYSGPFDIDTLQTILINLKEIDKAYKYPTHKTSGKVEKIKLPKDMIIKCNGIIHAASVACGGVGTGLAQIPASDSAVIIPMQISMIIGLGKVFGFELSESAAKSIIASAGASFAGRTVSQYVIGWVPGIGNIVNTATAAGLTELIGWIAVKNFYDDWSQGKSNGRYEGKKDGYAEASEEYEAKLRKQADEFSKERQNFKNEKAEYEDLLDEYEQQLKNTEQ